MRRTFLAGLVVTATACGIGLVGAQLDGTMTGADAAPDAPPPDGDVTPNDAAPDADAGPPPDASCDGGNFLLVDAGVLAITRLAAPPTMDGKLDEWNCVPFVTLDKASAAYALTSLTTSPSGSFAVAYEGTNLYIAAAINDPSVGGDSSTEPFFNDSVEIYLAGAGVLSGTYGTYDHQYIVDWKNLIKDYGPLEAGTPPTSQISAAIQLPSGGWTVEVKIALSTLNITTPAGKRIGFDMDFTEGSGSSQDQMLFWWMGPGTAAGQCDASNGEWCCGDASVPFCDTKRFGFAEFRP